METKKSQIILCADDYAISPAVSLGIMELIKKNRINATSVMSLSPFWAQDAKRLKLLLDDIGARDSFSIGLHLTLTDFSPITKMPKFAPNNIMPSLSNLLIRSLVGLLPENEIRAEIKSQFDAFIAHFGSLPDHIDGHCHVHLFPIINKLLIDVYKDYYKKNTAMIRNCMNSKINIFNFNKSFKSNLLHTLSKPFIKLLDKNKIPSNDSFSGVYNLKANNYHLLFKKFLQEVKGNTVIMCHPGYVDTDLKLIDPMTTQREVELDYFMGISFKEVLQQNRI